jgi:hypothetical protein
VLVRFRGDDALTDAVIRAVQDDGVCWLGGTTWRGLRAMRVSICNWATSPDDIKRSADSMPSAATGPTALRAGSSSVPGSAEAVAACALIAGIERLDRDLDEQGGSR